MGVRFRAVGALVEAVGELRPPCSACGIGGRDRASNTVRIDVDAADIDIDRSCVVRSRRKAGPLGIVRAESDDRRVVVVAAIEWSTRVEEAGEVLMRDKRVFAKTAVSS